MTFVYFSANEVFEGHVNYFLSRYPSSTKLGSLRKSNMSFITDVFRLKIVKDKDYIIYNTSPANILFSTLVRVFFKSRICFHLHDPIPHSGKINKLINILNKVQVCLSDELQFYSNYVHKEFVNNFSKYSDLPYSIINHPPPNFLHIKEVARFDYGLFGRNMPYKNLNDFIEMAKSIPEKQFVIVGAGYPNLQLKNLTHFDGFVTNDLYYSLMSNTDVIYLNYSELSFSGVLFDAVSLNRDILVSDLIRLSYPEFNDKYVIK